MTDALRFLHCGPVSLYEKEVEFLHRVFGNVCVAQGGVPLECFIGVAARLICDALDDPKFDPEIDIDDALQVVKAEVERILGSRDA